MQSRLHLTFHLYRCLVTTCYPLKHGKDTNEKGHASHSSGGNTLDGGSTAGSDTALSGNSSGAGLGASARARASRARLLSIGAGARASRSRLSARRSRDTSAGSSRGSRSRSLGGSLEGSRAGEVEAGSGREVLGDSELHLVVRVRVTEGIPESRDLAKQLAATDLLPEELRVLGRGFGLVPGLADVGPAGLGDPDGLAADGALDGVKGAVEEIAAVLNVVALAVLVVRVLVNTDPVDRVDDGLVGAVHPDVPRVDVADGDIGQGSALERLLPVADELDELVGTGANTGLVLDARHGNAVQILGTDGGADDQVRQLLAVLLDGVLQSLDLGLDGVGAGSPDAQKDLGVGLDGRLERLDRLRGLRVGLDVGVQTHGVEGAGGVLEVLSSGEFLYPVLLELGGTVGEGVAGVEAEVGFGGYAGSEKGGGAGEKFGGTHYVFDNRMCSRDCCC